MLDIRKDIHSLSDFKRNSARFVRRIKKSGHPLVLTVNGKAKIVVQDADSYQKLLEAVDRAEAVEAIREGLEDMKAGRVIPVEQFFRQMERKHKILRKNRK